MGFGRHGGNRRRQRQPAGATERGGRPGRSPGYSRVKVASARSVAVDTGCTKIKFS